MSEAKKVCPNETRKTMLRKLMIKLHRRVYKSRMTCLGEVIIPHLSENDKILDVGCGFGEFSSFIRNNENSPKGLSVIGVEKYVRPNTLIEVKQIEGENLPFRDNEFDCVMLLDVLHHEPNWMHLLDECIRVSKKIVIIKDHRVTTTLSYYQICLLDWLANKPYGIVCLYRYFTLKKWREIFENKKMRIVKEELRLRLYPAPYQLLFPGKLQYVSILRKN